MPMTEHDDVTLFYVSLKKVTGEVAEVIKLLGGLEARADDARVT